MRWAEYVVAFSDVADADLGIMTLPEIENKTGFDEAQTRQLHGMKWIYNNRKDLVSKKWFFFVDDDTWVNVPSLLDYISWFPEALPLSFSHIYLRHDRAVYNGGAGMLFSKEAFRRIAAGLIRSQCTRSLINSWQKRCGVGASDYMAGQLRSHAKPWPQLRIGISVDICF
ncbi:TPA: hypothetical protein ACH3X2_007775 [Trebouxia sp. C0005]